MIKKVLIILSILFLVGCGSENVEVTEDSKEFKKEYEALNGESNIRGDEYLSLDIDESNPFVYLDYEETIDLIENKSGILFFSRPGCPWCRATMEATIEWAEDNEVKKIYYYNPEVIREKNNLDYVYLLELLDEYLPVDTVTQKEEDEDFDPELKRLVVPHLFFIDNGEVKFQHQENRADYRDELTEEQKTQLKEIYNRGLESVGQTCDTSC